MISPLTNHIIYREDNVYLYPLPIHKNIAFLKQQGRFLNGSKSKYPMVKKVLKMQYVFPRHLKIDHKVQVNNTNVLKFDFLHQVGVSILVISSTYVPTKFKVTATVLPKQCEQENEYSFVFSGSDLWIEKSSTWITSIMYNINCSLPYTLSSYLLHLPYTKILEVCTSLQNRVLKQIFYIMPPVSKVSHSKWYVLTLILQSTMEYGSIIGTLKSSIISNKFCGNTFYVWYKTRWLYSYVWRRYPMKCLKLTFNQIIKSNFINQKGSYEILLYIEKSFATFKIHSAVSGIMNNNKQQSHMEYYWQHRNQGRTNYSQYKVFLSKSELS